MKKITLSNFILGLTFLFSGLIFGQASLYEIPLQEQINKSTLVVEGKVIAQKSFWDANYKHIFTANTIAVYKVFKGQSQETIEVITRGGALDNRAERVSSSLKLQIGAIGVFTLYDNNIVADKPISALKAFRPYSASQGFYKYNIDDNLAVNPFHKKKGITTILYKGIMHYTKQEYKKLTAFNVDKKRELFIQKRALLAVAISSMSPTTISAGTKSVLTINGSGFGATKGTVEFRNGDDGGATYISAASSQITSWTDTQITVEVPSEAGTGDVKVTHATDTTSATSATLTITFSEINISSPPEQSQHVGTYDWRMETSFDANTAAKDSFIRSLDTWRCTTGINWNIGAVTTVNDASSGDGVNVVTFDIATELSAGTLGECISYYAGCPQWFISGLDIVFDDETSWNFGPANAVIPNVDFESVSVHELGHGHQLGHVIDTGAIMHYSIGPGDNKRTLTTNDTTGAGGVQIRSTGSAVCGEPIMTNYSCTLSVNEEEQNKVVSLYPNPSKGIFYIKTNFSTAVNKAVIYDIRGRLIAEHEISNAKKTIDMRGASKGVYLINIHSESAMVTKKLIIK